MIRRKNLGLAGRLGLMGAIALASANYAYGDSVFWEWANIGAGIGKNQAAQEGNKADYNRNDSIEKWSALQGKHQDAYDAQKEAEQRHALNRQNQANPNNQGSRATALYIRSFDKMQEPGKFDESDKFNIGVKTFYASGWTDKNNNGRYDLEEFTPGLEVGDFVKKGNPIGRVGKTGYASGYHLHWELRVNNIPVDPLQWTERTF